MGNVLLLLAFFLAAMPAQAAPWCKEKHAAGKECWVKIKHLRPMQGSIGMVDVDAKKEKIGGLEGDELKKYLKKHPVKIVIGPGDEFYVVDGHHTARAVYENDLKEMRAEVVGNFSKHSQENFEKIMIERKWVHLADENGKPIAFSKLPKKTKELPDDPYRSLAWLLRKSGAFEKSKAPFAEFMWADYLRDKVRIDPGKDGMKKAFHEALAHIAENCLNLPGAICLRTPALSALRFKQLKLPKTEI